MARSLGEFVPALPWTPAVGAGTAAVGLSGQVVAKLSKKARRRIRTRRQNAFKLRLVLTGVAGGVFTVPIAKSVVRR